MTFEYKRSTWIITFKHETRYALPTDPNVMVRGTRCDIKPQGESLLVRGEGHSYCHPNDNFCRETGRKLALKKALLTATRPFRTAAWRAYLGRPRGKAQQHLDRLLKDHDLTEESVTKALKQTWESLQDQTCECGHPGFRHHEFFGNCVEQGCPCPGPMRPVR